MNKLVWLGVAVIALATPAAAEDTYDQVSPAYEVDTSFEVTQGLLEGAGYSDLRMINGNPYYLSGYDGEGSEVLLKIDETTGAIASSNYVRRGDQPAMTPPTVNPHL